MKKIYTYYGLVLISLLTIFSSCDKEEPAISEFNYEGVTMAHYEKQVVDSIGNINKILWDSTYSDEIMAKFEYELSTIQFRLKPQAELCKPKESTYLYALGLPEYVTDVSLGIKIQFNRGEDSLFMTYRVDSGSVDNFIVRDLKFKGRLKQ